MYTTLLDEITRHAEPGRRLIVGIAGAPGAGKSTLAARLASDLPDAAVVPMDGFHLSNPELARLGLAQIKGAPQTFDAAGYAALLRRLRSREDEVVYAPSFDHVMNEPIAGSIPIRRDTPVVVTEGNYLLLWDQTRTLLDLTVHIDADPDERVVGLLARQRAKGLDDETARDWVHRNDEANARLVQAHSHLAMLRLHR